MPFSVHSTPQFDKQFRKLDSTLQSELKDKLKRIIQDPTRPSLKLHQKLKNYFRFRIGPNGAFRVLYCIENDKLILCFVGKRDDNYIINLQFNIGSIKKPSF